MLLLTNSTICNSTRKNDHGRQDASTLHTKLWLRARWSLWSRRFLAISFRPWASGVTTTFFFYFFYSIQSWWVFIIMDCLRRRISFQARLSKECITRIDMLRFMERPLVVGINNLHVIPMTRVEYLGKDRGSNLLVLFIRCLHKFGISVNEISSGV